MAFHITLFILTMNLFENVNVPLKTYRQLLDNENTQFIDAGLGSV